MMTMDDRDMRRSAEKWGRARVLFARPAARWGVLALAAFVVAGGAGRSAWGQSQTKEVREHVSHAVVEVFTALSEQSKGDKPQGSGSGFFVNRTGLCITNDHVVDIAHGKSRWEKQRITYAANRPVWTVVVDAGTESEKTYEAFVLYENDLADQAILQVYDENHDFLPTPHYLKFFPGHRLKVGQKLWCYGFPGGDTRKEKGGKHPQVAISEGHIVGLARRPDGELKKVQTDVTADRGNSGGPTVDVDGYYVGTTTHKPVPEVGGRATQSDLVPADLTRQFIVNAFQRGKLESGIDLEPFYSHLVGRDGFVAVPGFPRQSSTDCIFMEDGNRICGAPVGSTVTLPTPLGKMSLPCAQMAYLLKQDSEYGIILMDGGQRLPFRRHEAVLKFTPSGGETLEQPLNKVSAVAFRKTEQLPAPPRGKSVLISGDNYYLLLKEVSGEAKFSSELGLKMSRALESISLIETRPDGKHTVLFADGSQVSGGFEDHQIKAVLAINGAPQTISLKDVKEAGIDLIDTDQYHKGGVELADLYRKGSPDLQSFVEQLMQGKAKEVKSNLAPQLSPESFNKQGEVKKDQLRMLEAMCDWSNGDFQGASRNLGKLKNSDEEGFKWFAQARLAVLDRFPDGKFDQKPLNDPKTFKKAGAAIILDTMHRTRELLGEREAPPPENRGMFMALRNKFAKTTEDLMIASQLGSEVAGVAAVWLWSWESDLLLNELQRLQKEMEDKAEELKKLQGTARDYSGRRLQKEIEDLRNDMKKTEEWYKQLQQRIEDLRFIIDDPDLDLLS